MKIDAGMDLVSLNQIRMDKQLKDIENNARRAIMPCEYCGQIADSYDSKKRIWLCSNPRCIGNRERNKPANSAASFKVHLE